MITKTWWKIERSHNRSFFDGRWAIAEYVQEGDEEPWTRYHEEPFVTKISARARIKYRKRIRQQAENDIAVKRMFGLI